MKDVLIRTIGPEEWRNYREVRLRALRESPDAFSSQWKDGVRISEEEWAARLARVDSGLDLPLAAVTGDTFNGLLWARIEADDKSRAQLYQMWVAPELRGAGSGKRMIETALAWLKTQGVTRVMLGVTCGDRPARRLYERMGFVPVGETEPLREGSLLEIQNMEYRFSCPET